MGRKKSVGSMDFRPMGSRRKGNSRLIEWVVVAALVMIAVGMVMKALGLSN